MRDLWGPGLIWNAMESVLVKQMLKMMVPVVHTYIHACIYVCMYVCIYVHQTYQALNSDSLSGEASEWSLHIELRPK